jgi:hypothetical protein
VERWEEMGSGVGCQVTGIGRVLRNGCQVSGDGRRGSGGSKETGIKVQRCKGGKVKAVGLIFGGAPFSARRDFFSGSF